MTPRELGIGGNGVVYYDLTVPQLIEKALARGEGVLSDTGALCVNTGKYTGRSPDDKFYVCSPDVKDKILWGSVNHPIEREVCASPAMS